MKRHRKTKLLVFIMGSFLALATVAAAQTSSNILIFKGRIGLGEDEVIEQVRLVDNRSRVLLIGPRTIQAWDLTNLQLMKSYPHEIRKRGGEYFQTSPDGRFLIGTRDRFVPLNLRKDDRPDTALIYDLSTGKQVGALQRPERPIRTAEWSANGKIIVTFSNTLQKETEISFWDGSDFSFRTSMNVRGYGWHYLTHDGSTLYVGSGGLSFFEKMYGPTTGSQIRAFNTATGNIEAEVTATTRYQVAYGSTFVTPDEKYLATEASGKIFVWDLSMNNPRLVPKYEIAANDTRKKLRLEGVSYDSRYWIAMQKEVPFYYESSTGRLVSDVPQLVELKFNYRDLILVPASHYAIAQDCGSARVIDLQNKASLYEMRFSCYSVSHDDGWSSSYTNDFVLPNDDGTLLLDFEDVPKNKKERVLKIRNLKSGEILETLSFPLKPVNRDYEPKWGAGNWWVKDNRVFAMGQDDRSILIWELKTPLPDRDTQ